MNTDDDRQHTIGVLERQAQQPGNQEENAILSKAAEILRKRRDALNRGPADAGGPVDEIKTR